VPTNSASKEGEKPGSDLMVPPVIGCGFCQLLWSPRKEEVERGDDDIPPRQERCLWMQTLGVSRVTESHLQALKGCKPTNTYGSIDGDLQLHSISDGLYILNGIGRHIPE